ncbi:type I-E CRISPR-associated protein Cas7/Cse4/CasC [Streptomyces sp. NBC_00144]|uniref:type I-E CRISPR-associated protein Cas7/Cse4/CasC n=1 Tax=Streptomyces sp. NBC_00144 TaxID=2975665 RepID=UPI00324A1324
MQQTLERAGWPADLAAFAGSQVAVSAGKKGIGLEAAGHTSVLLFLPEAAVEVLATVCAEHREALETALRKAASAKKGAKDPQTLPPNTIEEILKRRTASISLLGRMLAELPNCRTAELPNCRTAELPNCRTPTWRSAGRARLHHTRGGAAAGLLHRGRRLAGGVRDR